MPLSRQPVRFEPPPPPPLPLEAQAYKRAVAAILQRGLGDLDDITSDTEALWTMMGRVITDLKTEGHRWDRAAELRQRPVAAARAHASTREAGQHQRRQKHQHRGRGQAARGGSVASGSRKRNRGSC